MHFITPRTFYGKLFFGYGVFLVLFTVATGGVLFSLFTFNLLDRATIPVVAERDSIDALFRSLSVLDGEVARYDPILDPGMSSERIKAAVTQVSRSHRTLQERATLPDTISRLGLLNESVDILLTDSGLLPSVPYTEIETARARIFDETRTLRIQVSTIAADTAVALAEKEGARDRYMSKISGLIGLCALIFFMIGFAFSVIVSRAIAQPLRKIKDAAIHIAGGEYATRIPEVGHGDTRDLARSFNVMADRLTNYSQELEREVAQRTKDLNEKVVILNNLNRELDQNANLLVRRDMELTRANERLRELDRLKSEFLSVAAHQLRTPLSAVKWILSMVLEGQVGTLTKEQQSILEKGRESNERMVRLVDDMLAVTRIEGGRTEYTFARQSAADLLSDITAPFASVAAERGVAFILDISIDPALQVLVDPQKVRFVFDNLIDNAIKYTPAGGTATVRATQNGEQIVITVADTGIGIPESEQKNIFAKFFRASNAMKVVTDGNGLGLFVVKTIVERHGGTVGFSSMPGKGTTFTVSLPLLAAEKSQTPVSDPLDLPQAVRPTMSVIT